MRTVTPAPNGSPGLRFGATERPYSNARPHRGQDHQWRYADPNRSKHVYASVSGTVTAAFRDDGWNDGWGNYVDITVPTTDGSRVFARLAHHDGVAVNIGDQVEAGETFIGVMGDTGDTDGVHLHEELWINGERVDPVYYRTHDIPGTTGSAADDGSRPFKPKEWDEMASKEEIKDAVREVLAEQTVGSLSIVPLENGIYLLSLVTGRRAHIGSVYHVQLLQRAINNNSNDQMLSAELDIVSGYVAAVNPPAGATVDTDELARRLAELREGMDGEVVRQAVKNAIAETTFTVKAS